MAQPGIAHSTVEDFAALPSTRLAMTDAARKRGCRPATHLARCHRVLAPTLRSLGSGRNTPFSHGVLSSLIVHPGVRARTLVASSLVAAASLVAGRALADETLVAAEAPSAKEHGWYLHIGPKAGVSVNYDQWVAGAFLRAGGLCPIICLGDIGISVHEIGGLGGNYASVRTSVRLDSILWFGKRETFGVYPTVGFSARTLFPTGRFAEFCERTGLQDGCGGTHVGLELGVGLRFWPIFVEAVGATGELPSITATAGYSALLWEHSS